MFYWTHKILWKIWKCYEETSTYENLMESVSGSIQVNKLYTNNNGNSCILFMSEDIQMITIFPSTGSNLSQGYSLVNASFKICHTYNKIGSLL